MFAEVTAILGSEVHLVVICTCHCTIQHVTILHRHGVEVRGIQIIEIGIITTCRCIEVFAGTIAGLHLIERVT